MSNSGTKIPLRLIKHGKAIEVDGKRTKISIHNIRRRQGKKERHGSPSIRIVCPGNPTGFNIYSPAHIVSIEMAQKHKKKNPWKYLL